MAKTYTCPTCSATIPLDDINVSTDTALCRSCGETFSLSALVDSVDDSTVLSAKPPRGLRTERIIQGACPELTITYKRTSIGLAIFLTFFMCVWSGVSLYSLYIQPLILEGQAWGGDQSKGFPFLLGSIAIFIGWLFVLFGRRTITVNNGKGRIFTGIGGLGYTRRFTYNRQTALRVERSRAQVNNHPIDELQILTPDQKKVAFLIMRTDNADEYAFIAATLRTFFRS